MFEWYAELPRWQKVGFALVILATSWLFWVIDGFWPWGWAVGFALLIAAFVID